VGIDNFYWLHQTQTPESLYQITAGSIIYQVSTIKILLAPQIFKTYWNEWKAQLIKERKTVN
jgi:hypothetical protein